MDVIEMTSENKASDADGQQTLPVCLYLPEKTESEEKLTLEKEEETVYGVILASVSTDSINATIDILDRRASLLEVILLLFVFSLGLLLSGELVRPFEKLTREIQDVKAGFSSAPASVNDYLETENMVDAFNQDRNLYPMSRTN